MEVVMNQPQAQICSRCRKPASLFNQPYARRCADCLSTKLYHVSCNTPGCLEVICNNPTHQTCWRDHVPDSEYEREDHQIVDPFPSHFVDCVMHSEDRKEILESFHNEDKKARWFVARNREDPELWVYDRFIRLCDPHRTGGKAAEHDYPTFVSFIGNTTVGKSTIVRAMLLLGSLSAISDQLDVPTPAVLEAIRQIKDPGTGGSMPVPRSGHIDDKIDPTTFGVHLYHDKGPATMHSDSSPAIPVGTPHGGRFPLLMADCEGFEAGLRAPLAEKYANLDVVDEDNTELKKLKILAEYYLKNDRRGIDTFYARILYAISDVIVYITKSDSTFEPDLIKVLEWASAAVDKSYNQPSRKTLIIVRNRETEMFKHPGSSYSEEKLEQLFLRNYGDRKLWDNSPLLTAFVEKHNQTAAEGKRIQDNNQLYQALFQKIQCCFIADKGEADASSGRAALVLKHLKSLRQMIDDAAGEERHLKAEGYALYNVPDMDHILTQVFEHFAKSEDALDFYRAARRDNPTPRNIEQHVANFLRVALEHGKGADNMVIPMVVDTVALMMLIYTRRVPLQLNPPGVMLKIHLDKIWEDGVKIYLKEYEKCGFEFAPGVSCTVRGKENHKRHVYTPDPSLERPGRAVEAKGDFQKLWDQTDQNRWLGDIGTKFCQMFVTVFNHHAGQIQDPDLLIQNLRKKTQELHHHVTRAIRSTKTCLSCLQSVPDHVLPCGHSYCSRCVQEIGRPSERYECAFDISECTLCRENRNPTSHQVRLKPRCAGVRLLTLDGGGIRGIVSLAVLQAVHERVGLDIFMSELFDLVVGTSTGGIIALALVMGGKTLPECIEFFRGASEKTFMNARSLTMGTTKGLMALGQVDSLYSSKPLTSALSTFFRDRTSLFGPAIEHHFQNTTRVAVTTARGGGAIETIVANYNRPQGDWIRFEREDDITKDWKAVESGLATSAAPFYLSPFQKGAADYVDGAVYANCPAPVALDEMQKLWPDDGASLDILLSLGTGEQKKEDHKVPWLLKYGFLGPVLKMFERQTNSDETWDKLERNSSAVRRARLHRLNPPVHRDNKKGGHVELFEWAQEESLQQQSADWAAVHLLRIQHIANILMANLFFFEPNPEPLSADGLTFSGSIRCRLPHHSTPLAQLLQKIRGFSHAIVQSEEVPHVGNINDGRWMPINWETRWVMEGNNTQKFRVHCGLPVVREDGKYQAIMVHMINGQERIPISGFPVTLNSLKERAESRWLG